MDFSKKKNEFHLLFKLKIFKINFWEKKIKILLLKMIF
jgi:hypothetical protein